MTNNKNQISAPDTSTEVTIVYDGECPFCHKFTHLLRLRDSAGEVKLIDARSDDPQVHRVVQQGIDLDESMVVIIADRFYQGGDAMQVLALLSTRTGWFNRINYFVFRSRTAAVLLYPILRAGRNLALRILGHKPIN